MANTYYNVRALKRVRDAGIERIPGDAGTQDFVVDSATKDQLLLLQAVSVLGVASAAPFAVQALTNLQGKFRDGLLVGLIDAKGVDVVTFGATSGLAANTSTRALPKISRTAPKLQNNSSNLVNRTHCDTMTAPVQSFQYVRAIYRNYETTTADIDAIAFAVTNSPTTTPDSRLTPSVGNALTNDSTTGWVRGSFGGNSGITMAARISATQPSEYFSDWAKVASIPATDGSKYPYIMGRSYCTANNWSFLSYEQARSDGVAELGIKISSAQENIAGSVAGTPVGITNPASMTRSINEFSSFIFGFEFMSTLPVLDAIYVGDSRWANQPGSGFDFAAEILRTAGKSVCFSNCAWSGQTSATYAAFGKNRVASMRPSYAFYSVYGANDEGLNALSQAGADAMYARALDFGDYCRTMGTVPIMVFDCPNFNLPLAADDIRKFLTKRMEASGYLVCNVTSAVGNGASPEGWLPNMSFDYAHPYYPTGYRALGVAIAAWCTANLPLPSVTGL